jgi:predicted transcriptional regulator
MASASGPEKIIPLFSRKVFAITINDSIGLALNLMFKNSFSQLPVYKNNSFYDLLTNNTISRWLGANVKEEIISLKETPVTEVLKFTEVKDNYYFLEKDASIEQALEKFNEFEAMGTPLDAILITTNGSSMEELLGIITYTDLPKILNLLNNN